MPLIHPKGSPSARIWFIADAPLSSDIPKGFMFSGGAGYLFDQMCRDAGIKDYYVIARHPDSDQPNYEQFFSMMLQTHQPPFIVPLGEAAQYFLNELKPRSTKNKKTGEEKKESYKTALNKYVGSLLSCAQVTYPNYCMPLLDLGAYAADWTERQIGAYFDLQKLNEEFKFWKKQGHLQPLPFRQLVYQDMGLDTLLSHLARLRKANLISVDIETCYPRTDSDFYPHPGYPLTIGIADSPTFGISFNLFRENMNETKILWKELDSLLSNVPNLGQNYFNFDTHMLSILGFTIDKRKIQDTLIRHHVLWPELQHKLQFQTRQYTREIYYKDDGHHWNLKDMNKLRRYNCLDVCVTYEIYLAQEEEFALRKEIA